MDITQRITHTGITHILTTDRIDTMATIDLTIGTAAIVITAITAIIDSIGNDWDVSIGIPDPTASRQSSSQFLFPELSPPSKNK